MYEPSGGSAPDLTGLDVANPVAQILCTALMLRYTFALPEMAAAIESHTADRSALPLRIEDLTSPTSANATLTKLFGFLLGPRAVPRNFVEELVASAWKVMAGAARSEEAGAVQRAHLLKLLQKRPLKCQHVARMQTLLDYPPMKCVERAGVQQKPPQRHPAAGSAASHRRRLRQTSDNPLGSPSRAQRRGHRSGTALPLRARRGGGRPRALRGVRSTWRPAGRRGRGPPGHRAQGGGSLPRSTCAGQKTPVQRRIGA